LFPQLLIFSVVGDGVFGARSLPDSATRLLGEPPGEHPHSLARESFPDWDREYVIGGD
jgi:hypothetical protein